MAFQIIRRRNVNWINCLEFSLILLVSSVRLDFPIKAMMNHCVLDHRRFLASFFFCAIALKISSMLDGEVLELVWKDGEVVIRSKNKRSTAESSPIAERIRNRDNRALNLGEDPQVFMQENEMNSLLDFPLVVDPALENSFRDELLYPSLLRTTEQNAGDSSLGRTRRSVEFRQPIPLMRGTEPVTAANGFGVFSTHTGRVEPGPSNSKSVVRECPVVGPGGTSSGDLACRIMSGGDNVGRLINITGGETEPAIQRAANLDDRKRKGKETVDSDFHRRRTGARTDAKKQGLGSTSSKRSRAADVHNRSERKRRDRINERMKALQELIPDCTKTDKASMLNEAIEYLKSLQLQLQIMSKGAGMVATVVPGVQQVMPPLGMGFGMGMSMGMETCANRPMVPYPNMLAGSTFPSPAGAAQLGQPFTYPAFHMVPMVHVPNTDPSRFQGTNQSHYSSGMQSTYQPRVSSSLDAYEQFIASQQMLVPEAVSHPSAQIPPAALLRSPNQHTSWGHESVGNHEPGSPTMDPYY